MSENNNGLRDLNKDPVTFFRPSLLPAPSKPFYPNNDDATSSSTVTCASSVNSTSPSASSHSTANSNTENKVPMNYIFGSNISSRVVNADLAEGASSNLWNATTTVPKSSTSDSVFTDLAKVVKAPSVELGTLEDSAKKVSDDQKQALPNLCTVEVVTGEENEIQIVRQPCRIYIFDTDKQKWNNLGASHFHLNDTTENQSTKPRRSRVVVRLASTGKLLINTPVWEDMPVALVESRSLRIGAVSDAGQIKSYLIAFSVENVAAEIVEYLSKRKSFCIQANDNDRSIFSGQKRSADSSINPPSLAKVPAVDQAKQKSSPSISNLKTDVQPSRMFRPSVLTSTTLCNRSNNSTSVEQHSSSVSCGHSHFFRHSTLDNVVKQSYTATTVPPQSVQPCQHPEDVGRSSAPPSASITANIHRTIIPDANFMFGENTASRVANAESVSSVAPTAEDDIDAPDDLGEPASVQTLAQSASVVAAEMRKLSSNPKEFLPPLIVNLKTGEEGECTALKTYCQFYSFDRTKHEWVERGPAYIHLNDIPTEPQMQQESSVTRIPTTGPPTRSRMVARVRKTLKLLANTPIWSGMNVTMADQRSIRLTSMCVGEGGGEDEEGQGKSPIANSSSDNSVQPEFCAYLLVMRSPKEATRLYQALVSRMTLLTNKHSDGDPTSNALDPSDV